LTFSHHRGHFSAIRETIVGDHGMDHRGVGPSTLSVGMLDGGVGRDGSERLCMIHVLLFVECWAINRSLFGRRLCCWMFYELESSRKNDGK
jgi:hypothetical protein